MDESQPEGSVPLTPVALPDEREALLPPQLEDLAGPLLGPESSDGTEGVENLAFQAETTSTNPGGVEEHAGEDEHSLRLSGMPQVGCRVCGRQIPYDSNSMQHVVRCPACHEATPIRAAPTGKKFVRCPCNCLLICKVTSNRIACPRQYCGRVIILQPPSTGGQSIPAPAGTARVQCYFCEEIFMFNTLANHIAPCPHCQKRSSVGPSYVRTRSFGYFFGALLALLVTISVVIGTASRLPDSYLYIVVWLSLLALTAFFVYRFYYFVTLKISKVLGPL